MKVFVSYSHRQGEWVWDRLVPCLTAGGAEVLIDRERFEAGKAVIGQMDATQDRAHRHLLLLSREYLASDYCRHEMERAIRIDPHFERGVVVPVKLDDADRPAELTGIIYVDLRDDGAADQWKLLLDRCGAGLGATAPAWLAARDDVVRFLRRKQSVNLVVDGVAKWKPLIDHVVRDRIAKLAVVDLENPATFSRPGLVGEILGALGSRRPVPAEPDDLAELGRVLASLRESYVALTHFDSANPRWSNDLDLFRALRYFLMTTRQLVLLAQSRSPFDTFLPRSHPLSEIDIKTVELR